jgi:hypothetical protein
VSLSRLYTHNLQIELECIVLLLVNLSFLLFNNSRYHGVRIKPFEDPTAAILCESLYQHSQSLLDAIENPLARKAAEYASDYGDVSDDFRTTP